MKLFVLVASFLLMAAISHAGTIDVQASTVPVVTAIDTATVQVVNTEIRTVDNLNQEKQSIQARIDYTTNEFLRVQDQYNQNIAYWQERIKQINAMIFTATGK